MKIYLAGTTVSNPEKEQKIQSLFREGHKLHSYFHIQPKGFEHGWYGMNTKNKVDLFLDSGAFSAFTQGVSIDIQEYIAFIHENKGNLSVYANLDVIGSPEGTWKNQKIMERAGLNPLPCFHYGEDFKWLRRYLDQGYEYIALGGMVPISTPNLLVWLDQVFGNFICDEKGMPKIKVHGFGLTSFRLMLRYPWYSVDSTSWVVTGRMGSIYVPRFRGGKYVHDEDCWKICVSSRSPSKGDAGQHIDSLSPHVSKIFLKYIQEKGYVLGRSSFRTESENYCLQENEKWVGAKKIARDGKREVEVIEVVGLCNDYKLRDELNILYFLDLEKEMPEWPWAFQTSQKSAGFGF